MCTCLRVCSLIPFASVQVDLSRSNKLEASILFHLYIEHARRRTPRHRALAFSPSRIAATAAFTTTTTIADQHPPAARARKKGLPYLVEHHHRQVHQSDLHTLPY